MSRKCVVIVGGGPAGLYVAWRLAESGHKVELVERREFLGGLCASPERGGNAYGYGFHGLHAADPAFVAQFHELMGKRWRESEPRARVRIRTRFHDCPVGGWEFMCSMNPLVAAVCGAGLAGARFARPFRRGAPANAEQALIRRYGRPLYRAVFRDDTSRFWGVHPSRLSATLVQGCMPPLEAAGCCEKATGRPGRRARPVKGRLPATGLAKLYCAPGGMGEICEAMARRVREAGGRIHTGTRVTRVRLEFGSVRAVVVQPAAGGVEVPCDLLVWTGPLGELAEGMHPGAPPQVVGAARALKFRALISVALLVRKEQVFDSVLTYCHGRSFYRVAEPKHCGVDVTPPGCTALLADVSCAPDETSWEKPWSIARRVAADLEADGSIRADEIREIYTFRARHAYPVYTLGFEQRCETVQAYLDPIPNLLRVGRQATFSFMSASAAMQSAWAAVSTWLQGRCQAGKVSGVGW